MHAGAKIRRTFTRADPVGQGNAAGPLGETVKGFPYDPGANLLGALARYEEEETAPIPLGINHCRVGLDGGDGGIAGSVGQGRRRNCEIQGEGKKSNHNHFLGLFHGVRPVTGWPDKLREASFRGVVFLYEDAGDGAGRRLATHEYPGRDEPYTEDLGRKQRTYDITAYMLGADHIAEAEKLVEACEKAGPGRLVHPYLGERQVFCPSVRRRYSTGDGRVARLDLTFVEAGSNLHPASGRDTASLAETRSDGALTDLSGAFETSFTTDGKPGFVADSAAALVEQSVGAIRTYLAPAFTGENLASFTRRAGLVSADATNLVRTPPDLASAVLGLLAGPAGSAPPPARYTGLLSIASSPASWAPVTGTTAARLAEAANQAALGQLIRRGAVIEAARAAVRTRFTTADEAWSMRDNLSDRLDTEVLDARHADVPGLTDLTAAVVTHLARVAPALPRTVAHAAAATLPVLRIAHDLYGDDPGEILARATEIALRNRLRHPGMAPAQTALEVLTRV